MTSGMIRKVDHLGRVVLPKEIRKVLRINYDEPMEVFVKDGDVILRKHSKIALFEELLPSIIKSLSVVIQHPCVITDLDKAIVALGLNQEVQGLQISNDMRQALLGQCYHLDEMIMFENQDFTVGYAELIVCNNTVQGVAMLAETEKPVTSAERSVMRFTSMILGEFLNRCEEKKG